MRLAIFPCQRHSSLISFSLAILYLFIIYFLSHSGVSLDTHWIILELEGNLLKQPLKATLDRIWCFIIIICQRNLLKITLIDRDDICAVFRKQIFDLYHGSVTL